jgi:hypothetical protein
MQTYRIEATVLKNGTLTIKGLPFQAGDKVEVIVSSQEQERKTNGRYPLRGKPVRYVDPFKGVAEDDWEALR